MWDWIPENVKTAFSSSDELCLELELLDAKTALVLSDCRQLPGRKTVDSVLPQEMITRISDYLNRIKQLLPKWMNHGSGGSTLFGGNPSRYGIVHVLSIIDNDTKLLVALVVVVIVVLLLCS